MRYTLEQLQVMTDEDLFATWADGIYPFDRAGCGSCLTVHAAGMCHTHVNLIPERFDNPGSKYLRQNLEELYALRIFHDALYPQLVKTEEHVEATEQYQEVPVRSHP